jgi:hypothetical protein
MPWLRTIRRFGAGLGLFALLLQLALSFGHIHPEDLLPQSFAGHADRVVGRTELPAGGQDRHVPGTPHDDCPICAVMHLAGTIVIPDAPTLALPTQFITVSFSAGGVSFISIPRRLPFQTRAPPTA